MQCLIWRFCNALCRMCTYRNLKQFVQLCRCRSNLHYINLLFEYIITQRSQRKENFTRRTNAHKQLAWKSRGVAKSGKFEWVPCNSRLSLSLSLCVRACDTVCVCVCVCVCARALGDTPVTRTIWPETTWSKTATTIETWLIICLFVWLVGRLVAWLFGWLFFCLVRCLVGYLVGFLIACSLGRLPGCLVSWLLSTLKSRVAWVIGLFVGWLVACLYAWLLWWLLAC